MTGARWIPYRTKLTARAQALRRDPTPAEKKLWYEFLRDLPHKFTRQKPLGQYVAEAQRYDKARTAALEAQGIWVIRFTNADVLQNFRSEEHTSELQSQSKLVCRLLLEKKKQ